MRRREFFSSTGAALSASAAPQGSANSPWNVLVIVSDTVRKGFLEPYGNRVVKTPNLARLAAESAIFEHCRAECQRPSKENASRTLPGAPPKNP